LFRLNRYSTVKLVNEPPQARYYSPRLGWFASWWLRSPQVPVWLKSRRHTVQALKDLAVAVVRSPDRYVFAVVRGLVAGARWWRRWVTVRDYRQAAELSEKLADKFVEIRALTLFRWKVTGAGLVAAVVGLALVDLVWGRRWFWLVIATVSVALAMLGRRRDGSPGRKASRGRVSRRKAHRQGRDTATRRARHSDG
jgi:S-DNA-T family DNA segregation ATPase FtsK/SpoIIIE